NTETGLPSDAQTLLKLTPAAITRTITSKAPGSGTSICSSWKASLGSPSRSLRITHAAIVSGSVPGSTSSWVRLLVSTDKFLSIRFGSPPAGRILERIGAGARWQIDERVVTLAAALQFLEL